MSDSPKSPADIIALEKAQKRAEVEQRVAAGRAKLAAEKELQKKAEEEKLKLEHEKEAKRQSQIRSLVQAEMAEKDAQMARNLAQKEEQQRAEREQQQAFLMRFRQNPLETIQEAKVISFIALLFAIALRITFHVGCGHEHDQGARVRRCNYGLRTC
jgi:hypothetical protein